jgi:UBX domain
MDYNMVLFLTNVDFRNGKHTGYVGPGKSGEVVIEILKSALDTTVQPGDGASNPSQAVQPPAPVVQTQTPQTPPQPTSNSIPIRSSPSPVAAIETPPPAPTRIEPAHAQQPTVEEEVDPEAVTRAQLAAYREAQKSKDKGKGKEMREEKKPENNKVEEKKRADYQRANYIEEQRKRKVEAKKEKQRILAQIENDKAERKHREEQRRAIANAGSDDALAAPASTPLWLAQQDAHANSNRSVGKSHAECAIQIRLFDGSTIRTRFPSNKTLQGDVREWIDSQKEDTTPYNFKQILTPLPNRSIEMSEEDESLHNLGLTPSATLVLVPVQSYSSAYDPSSQGYLARGLSAGYGLVSGGVGLVAGTIGSVLGVVGGTRPATENTPPAHASRQENEPVHQTMASGPSRIKIRTLGDQRKEDEPQKFYNGNQVRWPDHFFIGFVSYGLILSAFRRLA